MRDIPGKSQIPLNSDETVDTFENVPIKSGVRQKFIGITFDSELKFEVHTSKTKRNIVNKKLYALHCIPNPMSQDKRKMLNLCFH